MKILMIGPARSVHGGISGVVNNYYDAGLDKKVDLTYIGTMVEGSKVRKLLQAVIALVQYVFCLPGCDIVHVNVASDASFLRKSVFILLAHLCGKKLVIHQHGGDFVGYYETDGNEKRRRYVRKIFGMADAFLVLAPFWKEFFSQILPEEKITVLPDAIKIPEQAQKEYGQRKLLFLGRLCKGKGICELLDSVGNLKEKYPDMKLYLGGIWEEPQLQHQAEACGAAVEWLGWISGKEKEEWLQKCDIFVLPSYFEGQSVSLLEAMAASCAPVVSEVGGIPMMITGEENGIFVKPQDAASLEAALDRVLADPALCERLGRTARQRAQQDFSLEDNMRKLLAIYERVMNV